MSSGILDSSILIDCLRGRTDAIMFLRSRSAAGPPITHLMVVAELLAGARDKREQDTIDSFLTPFQILSPNQLDALGALDLYRRYRLSHGVDWPDWQIAATAIRHGIEVCTQNVKHFAPSPISALCGHTDPCSNCRPVVR